MSFKLLAIRPMPGTDPKFLKNLKPGVIYKFYQEYQYTNDEYPGIDFSELKYSHKEVEGENEKYFLKDDSGKLYLAETSVTAKNVKPFDDTTVPEDLYSIPGGPTINISAIVGKNGSGKSSLLELLFKQVYNLSVTGNKPLINLEALKKDIESDLSQRIDKELKENETIKRLISNLSGDDAVPDEIIEEIEALILEKKGVEDLNNEKDKINSLIEELDSMDLSKIQVFFASKPADAKEETVKILETEKLDSDFYSIVLNYSTYSLNSNIVGYWIDKLFHKNDGYLTPIVLNPMRTGGDIDVNNENHLNKSRLLLNLSLLPVFDKEVREIAFRVELGGLKPESKEGKTVIDNVYSSILFKAEDKKTFQGYPLDYRSGKMNSGQEKDGINELDAIEQLSDVLRSEKNFIDLASFNSKEIKGVGEKTELNDTTKKELLKFYLFKYLLNKIIKYAKIVNLRSDTDSFIRIKDVKGVLNQIKKDPSHQTFKIYQILHLLQKDNFEKFYDSLASCAVNFEQISLTITKEDFDTYLNGFTYLECLAEENKFQIYKAPAAFFGFEFQFENESGFSSLSSGEQQLINSINTIAYHLRNIDSKEGSYKKINVIFDEVELYFHVDYQRQYISKLIEAIKLLELKRIAHLNILFSTHSPFILSDIPSQNVLRLENGEPLKQKSEMNSFAANMYDLLDDDFFLCNGVIGEFAREKVQILSRKAQYGKEDLKMIDLIGDEFLRSVLLDRSKKMNKDKEFVANRILQLKEEIKQLEEE